MWFKPIRSSCHGRWLMVDWAGRWPVRRVSCRSLRRVVDSRDRDFCLAWAPGTGIFTGINYHDEQTLIQCRIVPHQVEFRSSSSADVMTLRAVGWDGVTSILKNWHVMTSIAEKPSQDDNRGLPGIDRQQSPMHIPALLAS